VLIWEGSETILFARGTSALRLQDINTEHTARLSGHGLESFTHTEGIVAWGLTSWVYDPNYPGCGRNLSYNLTCLGNVIAELPVGGWEFGWAVK